MFAILLHAFVKGRALFGGEVLGEFGTVFLHDVEDLAAGAVLVSDEFGTSGFESRRTGIELIGRKAEPSGEFDLFAAEEGFDDLWRGARIGLRLALGIGAGDG